MQELLLYVSSNYPKLLVLSYEHLLMALAAVLIGMLVGVPLGIFISRYRRFVGPVLWLCNAFQTIPNLALIGFFMILLGIGKTTAIVSLFFYTLMPIVRATYTGIRTVDTNMIEVAQGMGMTKRQILSMVQLPISLSVLIVGVRVAAVISIGTTTVMSLIGAGGLGYEIFTGITRTNNSMIVAGAILVAILAISVNACISYLERKITSPGLQNL